MPEFEFKSPAKLKEKLKRIVARAILLNEQNQILLGKRVRGGGVGKWALIGGKPDGSETPQEAIVREVKEELGVDFRPVFLEKIRDKQSSDRAADERQAWDVYVYYGKFKGVPAFKPDEISEIALVSREQLQNFDIAFNHKEILNNFFKQETKR